MITTLAMGTFSFLSTADTLVTLLIGILSFFGSSLMVLALQVEDVGTVQLIRKADDILLAFVIQILYFQQYPDLSGAIGAVIIVLSVVISCVRKVACNSKDDRDCNWYAY